MPDRRKQAHTASPPSLANGAAELSDAASLPRVETKRCPKCGSDRTAITARLDEEAHNLSLYRCETCGFRFSQLTSAES